MKIKRNTRARREELSIELVEPCQVFEYKDTLFIKLDSNFTSRYFSSFQENGSVYGDEDNYNTNYHDAEESFVRSSKYNAIRISTAHDSLDLRDRLVCIPNTTVVYNINGYTLVHDSILNPLPQPENNQVDKNLTINSIMEEN